MDQRIQRALRIINQNYNRPLPLHPMAAKMNLSPSRFEHLFKQAVGLSYKAYLKNRRLQTALRLLENGPLRIKQIAHQVGYSDAVNFTHDFKKRFKKAPSVYRKNSPSRFHQEIADSTK